MVTTYGQLSEEAKPEEDIAREAANPIDEPFVSIEWVIGKLKE